MVEELCVLHYNQSQQVDGWCWCSSAPGDRVWEQVRSRIWGLSDKMGGRVEAFAVPNQSAVIIARLLVEEPRNNLNQESDTSGYHPQTNGVIEKFNSTEKPE